MESMARHRAFGHTIGGRRNVWHRTFHPDVSHPEFCSVDIPPRCLTSRTLLRRHSIRMSHIQNSAPPPFHPDVPHPEFCSVAIPPGCLTSGTFHSDISHPTPDARWERRAFQLPRSDISGSSNSVYPESFIAILHSATVFS